MTNEQLAGFIKIGGNDELIPILWERIRRIMYMKSDTVYRALEERFTQCGVDVWDLKQSCYIAFLKAIEGYKPDTKNKFTSYLSYHFKTVVNELLGYRTAIAKNEPLNNDYTSLDTPLKEDEPDSNTIADIIKDDNAVNAPELVQQEDEYRILHEIVNALKPPQNVVINAYYFEEKSMKEIGANMNVSSQYISQVLHKALRHFKFSEPLQRLHKENKQHEILNSMQKYYSRPDKHLYILELEEKYKNNKKIAI